MKPITILKTAFAYCIAAMAFGVFYREYTKFNGFSERTALSFTHLHLFVLGMFLFLLLFLFSLNSSLHKQKRFILFYRIYNIALPLMVVMLAVRGVTQVTAASLTTAQSAMISGIAGLSHIGLLAAFLLLFSCFFRIAKESERKD